MFIDGELKLVVEIVEIFHRQNFQSLIKVVNS
jgi:hypothetical protein